MKKYFCVTPCYCVLQRYTHLISETHFLCNDLYHFSFLTLESLDFMRFFCGTFVANLKY